MQWRAPERREAAWLLLSVVPVAIAVARSDAFPVSDSALFEYVGRALLHGQRLYRDVWDNKLPSIYLADALWQAAFAERYRLHTLAEAAVNVAALGAFASLARSFGLRGRGPATFGFALAYSVPLPLFNAVEHYAIALVLGGYLAAQRGRRVAAGIALALATTFWLPAVLLLGPPLAVARNARERSLLAAPYLLTLGAYGATLALAVGSASVAELVRSWFGYAAASALDTGSFHRFGPLSRTYSGLVLSGVAALLAVLAAVVRVPGTEAQRFGLWWCVCALAGGLLLGNGFAAYFFPSIPALVFTSAAFGPAGADLRRAVPALLVALLAASRAVWWAHYTDQHARAQSEAGLLLGARLKAALGQGIVMQADTYAPELFLASDVRLVDRYGLVPPELAAALRRGHTTVRQPDVVVESNAAGAPRYAGSFRGLQRCAAPQVAEYVLYVSRRAAAKLGC